MPNLLLGAESGAPVLSYPWWVTNALVPAAISVFGSLLTLLVVIATASRTEWYRRLSRWEPYSKDLWLLQVTLYGEICQAAPRAMLAAYDLAYHWRDGDPERNRPLDQAYKVAKTELDGLGIQARILLSRAFNEVYTKFDHKVFILGAGTQSAPNWRLAADKHSDEMYALFGQLLEAARANVNADALDKKTKEAILAGIKQGGNNGISPSIE